MTILQIIIIVLVIVVVFWLLLQYVKPALPAPFGNLVIALFALIVIVWLLSAVGLLPGLNAKV